MARVNWGTNMLSHDRIAEIANGYTAAWNSGSAAAVADHYAVQGGIVINHGVPWVGRAQVQKMSEGFFADVPDLSLTCDGLRIMGDHVIYLWTFTGHHSGTKNPLRIVGVEEWDLDSAGKVAASRGWYDGAEYARQVAGG